MDIIKEISKWLMPVCITGCAARAVYCLIQSNVSEEDAPMFKKRAKHAVKFAIMAALTEAVKQLAEAYFNGGKSI
ncbi:hypothetical protein LY28_03742 [Ruminiclostridium sufflavum DSM 19573]|uniref:Uncharacterized protein n=1 Tax=Ruminiclostridium sufflavum DSM 19573 TaxID=1121337 RepID=A0A318XFK3_9FIRM|nr:hypothetical protein [Ruminiclostridium sufflavum]PYG84237.1 hypothetical protein LY28_03742 [Ruminiclostridium sufflavum DSM 19573]